MTTVARPSRDVHRRTIGAPSGRTAVAQKVTMAVTGLILVAYLISHVLANMLAYAGARYINGYGDLLRATGPRLWGARATLLAAAVLHVRAAVQLARAARTARGGEYARQVRQASSYATRTIRWGGALLFVYLLVHVPMFTGGVLHPSFVMGDDYHNVVHAFRNPRIATLNFVAGITAGLHVYHGVRAAAASLGTPTRAARVVRHAALGIGLLIGLGFASLPLAVVAGILAE